MSQLRQMMVDAMRIRNYSPRTIETYVSRVAHFAAFFGRSPAELGPEHVQKYQVALVDAGVSWSVFNQSVCALRLLYLKILKRPWSLEQIPFPRQPKRLPLVVGPQVVERILREVRNARHRLVLETLYATGLRLNEALHLQASDIDSEREVIRVRQGKGQKERYTILPKTLLDRLRDYWRSQRLVGPWLFPGQHNRGPISPTAIQQVIVRARERAGLSVRVSCHTLRHCFATRLLERGVDVRTIQVLMGHRALSTTSRYLHLAGDQLRKTGGSNDLLEELDELS